MYIVVIFYVDLILQSRPATVLSAESWGMSECVCISRHKNQIRDRFQMQNNKKLNLAVIALFKFA